MRKGNSQAGSRTIFCAVIAFALLLTACGGSDSAGPTATSEPAVAAITPAVEQATPTATAEPETPTPSPEPEPSATPTRSGPAPTVAQPIQRQPTALPPAPTPVPEAEPTEEVPSGETGEPTIGALLLDTDLSDWEQVEFEFGRGFIAGGTYHINVVEPEGAYIILRSNQNDFANVLVSIDVRMVSAPTEAYGCVTTRTDINYQFYYSMCIGSSGATRALYEYFDAEGNYFSEILFDVEMREGTGAPGDWNNLSIIAVGEELGFFINDTFLGRVTHSGPSIGSVGFYVENYDPNGAEFEFANLTVWAVE